MRRRPESQPHSHELPNVAEDGGDDAGTVAPSAMRIPISRVCCATRYATTAKMPTAEMTRPSRQKIVFRQRHEFMRWMTWLTDSGVDAEFTTPEQRTRG